LHFLGRGTLLYKLGQGEDEARARTKTMGEVRTQRSTGKTGVTASVEKNRGLRDWKSGGGSKECRCRSRAKKLGTKNRG